MNFFNEITEEAFWLTLWTFVITGVVAIAFMIAYVSWDHNRTTERLISAGHDPVELACLLKSSSRLEIPCLKLAEAKAKVIEAEIKE